MYYDVMELHVLLYLNGILSLHQVLDEAARSLHDALCVIRCLVNQRYLIAGWFSIRFVVVFSV